MQDKFLIFILRVNKVKINFFPSFYKEGPGAVSRRYNKLSEPFGGYSGQALDYADLSD
jgi:hypothetical protein